MAAKWESRNYLAALVAGTALLAAAGSGAASEAANASEDTPVAAATKAPPFLNRTFAIVRGPNLPQFFPKRARQTTALFPHRKSTPKKRIKRKWAAKTKGENNISDAAAAKRAKSSKSALLLLLALLHARCCRWPATRRSHRGLLSRAFFNPAQAQKGSLEKSFTQKIGLYRFQLHRASLSLIRRFSSHPTIACTTVTYAVGLN